jgi:hypothetical protein
MQRPPGAGIEAEAARPAQPASGAGATPFLHVPAQLWLEASQTGSTSTTMQQHSDGVHVEPPHVTPPPEELDELLLVGFGSQSPFALHVPPGQGVPGALP